MFPGDRSNFGRRRPAGFPQFPDPFAGFAMPGGSTLLEGFFGRDPFDDPFFTSPFGGMPFGGMPFGGTPFGSMFGPPGGLLGSNAVFRHGGLFGSGGLFGRPDGLLLEERPISPQPEGRRGPVIEELPDDHETPENHSRQRQEPIIEHPDDEISPSSHRRDRMQSTASQPSNESRSIANQPRNLARQGRSFQSQPNTGYQCYSFSSSTVMAGGPGRTHYSASSMRSMGPDGVMEEVHTEKDSASATETRSATRAIGEKVHAVSRKRNASGQEETLETLCNLAEDETADFDKDWKTRAERSFPGWNRNRSQMLDGNRSGSSSHTRLALPSNEGFYDESYPPKKLLRS